MIFFSFPSTVKERKPLMTQLRWLVVRHFLLSLVCPYSQTFMTCSVVISWCSIHSGTTSLPGHNYSTCCTFLCFIPNISNSEICFDVGQEAQGRKMKRVWIWTLSGAYQQYHFGSNKTHLLQNQLRNEPDLWIQNSNSIQWQGCPY